MSITREQLALAAKAAGIVVAYDDGINLWIDYNRVGLQVWNPQYDHGQLLDLAMACRMCVDHIEGWLGYQVDDKESGTKWNKNLPFEPQDFPSLAEAVITAAAEKQQAKEAKE